MSTVDQIILMFERMFKSFVEIVNRFLAAFGMDTIEITVPDEETAGE